MCNKFSLKILKVCKHSLPATTETWRGKIRNTQHMAVKDSSLPETSVAVG